MLDSKSKSGPRVCRKLVQIPYKPLMEFVGLFLDMV